MKKIYRIDGYIPIEFKDKVISTETLFNGKLTNAPIAYDCYEAEYHNEDILEFEIEIVSSTFGDCALWYRYFKQQIKQIIGADFNEIMKIKADRV